MGTENGSERDIASRKRERGKKLWMIIASHLLSDSSLQLKVNNDGEVEAESESCDVENRMRTEQAQSVLALLEGTQTLHWF